jgi:transcriptional regulator with XRE-family HTH domain
VEVSLISGSTVRSKRLAAGISAEIVAIRSGIDRARVSRIERELITASPGELQRIDASLDQLIEAKRRVETYAASVGCPVAVLG